MALTSENIILLADAYKYSQPKLYWPGTNKIYSYLESRGGEFGEMMLFGPQYVNKEYLEGPVITKAKIDEAEDVIPYCFPQRGVFDRSLFDYILNKYGGHLPVTIKAVPEGTVIPSGNALLTVENEDEKLRWLPDFLEDFLVQLWFPSTIGTHSRELKKEVKRAFIEMASESAQWMIEYAINDFGLRSSTTPISAAVGGMGHLLSFRGSDTVIASVYARRYYNAAKIYGQSVPATQHSMCCMLGELREVEMLQHTLNAYPTGPIACISDTFNIFRDCADYWGGSLKDQVMNRDGVLTIRCDSGNMEKTLSKVFEILFEKFGLRVNEKGFKVLPEPVRVMQSDKVNRYSLKSIYQVLKVNKTSPENLFFGSGNEILQNHNRDTHKIAMKASYAEINGQPRDIRKDPMEMNEYGEMVPSFKKSKSGRLKLVKENGIYRTVPQDSNFHLADELVPIFKNGECLQDYTFEEVMARAAV